MEDHLAALILHADPPLTERLVGRLAPVLELPAGERDRLLATLRAWLGHQRHTPAVAAELHVHPQTVRYRLGRLRELFGDSLEDPERRLELELALRGDSLRPARSERLRAVSSLPDHNRTVLGAHDPQRASDLLQLEFGTRQQFADPSLEYRRLFSELLGTFMLVLVAAGGGILHAKGEITLSAAVVAPGLMVMAIILFMGAVSGAHLNPVVSIAFALRGDFPWRRVPGYIVVQLVGATLACVFLLAVLGNVKHLGATLPGPGYAPWQAFLLEVVLTTTLVSVILGTASAAQNVGTFGALGVGGYIALAGLWAAPVSGTSMNPARSFGPALVSGDWTDYWLYAAGPLAGALIAVGCAYVLRGRGGHDAAARAAASGRLPSGGPEA